MQKERIAAFADKVYGDMAGAMTAGMGFLGVAAGLFGVLAGKGWMTSAEIAEASKLHQRYVEEWLNGMAAAGYLDYNSEAGSFRLPDEHAYLLASEGSDHYMGGLLQLAPVLLRVAPQVAEGFRNGGGVPFEAYGSDGVAALDMLNRGQYEQRLAGYWLGHLPDVVARLKAGGTALDVGCGTGSVALTLAKAFPACSVVGLDPDPESIRQARAASATAGSDGRVTFVAATTHGYEVDGGFDLATACDCLHDFAEPEETLTDIRALLKPDGALFVVEPKAGDRLEDNLHPLGTMYYGFSLFHCMTQSLARGGPGLGTCMGPERTESLLSDAGFSQVERLPIRSQTHLFYAARP